MANTPLYGLLILLCFGIVWAVGLGSVVSTASYSAVIGQNLTGLEAMFYSNLNVIVFIGWLLSFAVVTYFVAT